jgi:Tfp pilus assembly protein PilN
MRAVNLLPRDAARSGLKPTAPLLTGVIGSVLVTTALCVGFLLESAKVAEKRNELDAARAELALVPPPALTGPTDANGLAGQEAARVTALQAALTGRVAWDRLLREVSMVLPKDVWLSALTLATPAPGDVTGTPFVLIGNAYSHEGVARLLSRLALIPDLTNVRLDHSNKMTPGERSAVEFKIMAAIRQPGATS